MLNYILLTNIILYHLHLYLPSSPALTMSFRTPTSAPACLTPKALPRSSATWAATSTPTSSIRVAVPTGKPKSLVILSRDFGPTPSYKVTAPCEKIQHRAKRTNRFFTVEERDDMNCDIQILFGAR